MKCMADFVLSSDLCLAEGAPPLKIHAPDGTLLMLLQNAAADPELPAAVLSGQLFFEASEFGEGLRDVACKKIAAVLNCLTFATNRKFSLTRLKKIVDWTPGLTERQSMIYQETPVWDTAEPGLDDAFIDTAERTLAMQEGEEPFAAMRWYRLGIEADVIEDQFSYFWFALEIAAEASKNSAKIASKCPKCSEDLFCQTCNAHPLHRPYPREAIRQAVEKVHPDNSQEVFETLEKIRHTLMHGRRIASILDKLPCSEQQAVDKLARVTWNVDQPDVQQA